MVLVTEMVLASHHGFTEEMFWKWSLKVMTQSSEKDYIKGKIRENKELF